MPCDQADYSVGALHSLKARFQIESKICLIVLPPSLRTSEVSALSRPDAFLLEDLFIVNGVFLID